MYLYGWLTSSNLCINTTHNNFCTHNDTLLLNIPSISLIKRILDNSTHESPHFNFIIEAVLSSGISRTVGQAFLVNKTTNLEVLSSLISEYIEKFEIQSGTPEERQPEEVYASLIRVIDRSDAPAVNWKDPLALPFSEKSPVTRKARTTRKNTEDKLAILNSQLHTGFENLNNSLSSEIK